MYIIKLDAIDSTNSYLKNMCRDSEVENFTVVYTACQTNGRGQMGSTWISEDNKNLTMSILSKNLKLSAHYIFDLNVIVACSIIEVLHQLEVPNLKIKWPNDIMADGKKIGGILIENTFSTAEITSIIGIGINVNQTEFKLLPQASSIYNVLYKTFDVDSLLVQLATKIKHNVASFSVESALMYWDYYHSHLFKKNIPTTFEDKQGEKFMGIIKNVNRLGQIEIQLEDDSIKIAGLKDIKMLF